MCNGMRHGDVRHDDVRQHSLKSPVNDLYQKTPKKRAKKAPSDLPKKPKNSFTLWFDDNKELIKVMVHPWLMLSWSTCQQANDDKEENPDMSASELRKEGKRMWDEAGEEEQGQYEALAEVAKEDYTKAMAEYTEKHKVRIVMN